MARRKQAQGVVLSPLVSALAEEVRRVAKKIDGAYCYGLPHYQADAKLKLSLAEIGEMDLFVENEVDAEEWPGWVPFAYLEDESQFLAIQTAAPFPVGMWEHEDGKIHPVWPSLSDFESRLLKSKKEKTPFERLDGTLEEAQKLVNAGRHQDALPALEEALTHFPAGPSTRRNSLSDRIGELFQRVNNLLGLSLQGLKRHEEALAAFERAAEFGDFYAELNILGLTLNTRGRPQEVIERARKLRNERFLNTYVRVWVAIYIAEASLDLGDAATAEKELRDLVKAYRVSDAEQVTAARKEIEDYIADGRPGAKLAEPFLEWLKPNDYKPSSGQATDNRAWWNGLPEGMRETLFKEVKLTGDLHKATDEQIAHCLDTEECDVKKVEDHPIMDVTPFLRLTNARRISFYGDPDTIEPLRSLPRLTRLNVNNVLIKNFQWPSRAQRDLWEGAKKGDRKAMEKALRAGAEINSRSHDFGRAAVHFVWMSNESVEEKQKLTLWLMQQGADPYAGSHGSGESWFIDSLDEAKRAEAHEAMRKWGIPPIERERYREFKVKNLERSATFEAPEFHIPDKDFDRGDSLVGEWPKNATLKMRPPKKDKTIHDIMCVGYDEPVVSERVSEVLASDPNIELLPVKLLNHQGKPVAGNWFFLNPLKKACLAVDRCFPKWNHINPETASKMSALVIDEAKTEGAQMFRPTVLNGPPMIVTAAMAEKLQGFSGAWIRFLPR